jgi:hypothetical protein
MPRLLGLVAGISGLVLAAYLIVFYRAPQSIGLETPIPDGALFGIAIGVVSLLVLGTTRRESEPSASASMSMTSL